MRQNIGGILKSEFNERKKKNKAYSLRAFSRDLKMSVSFLSEVMKGKKTPSTDKALEICQAIGWSWRETQIFLQTAQLAHTKSAKTKNFLKKELKKTEAIYQPFKQIKAHVFADISNWYHFAIMELTELPDFSAEAEWIARRLGISKKEAGLAFSQLQSKEFLQKDHNGKWSKNNHSVHDTPSAAIRKFHQQHLANAATALDKQDFHQRHFSGVTMAINSKKIPEAVELIREFRSRMNLLMDSGTPDSVYHLAIQLFQLDQSPTENKK